MGRTKKPDNGNTFPAKFAKVLGQEWMSECDSLPAEDLKKIVIEAESSIEEQENLRDADEKLKEITALKKELSAAYKDSLFYQKAKIKYAMKNLESKGQLVTKD